MMWITKYRHNKIVEQYQETIKDLKKSIERKEKFEEICGKLADISDKLVKKSGEWLTMDNLGSVIDFDVTKSELILPDHVPVYVEDVNGGKVIKQEATPVTILDADGKATYGYTKEKPDKGKNYQLKETVVKERK